MEKKIGSMHMEGLDRIELGDRTGRCKKTRVQNMMCGREVK
jgi:hypothetical protein